MGMTHKQFWKKDCTLVIPYRRAYLLRQEQENRIAWLQGMYFYEALCDVSPVLHAFAKSGTQVRPYSENPYEFTQTKKQTQEETNRIKMQKTADYMQALSARFRQTFAHKKAQAEPAEKGVNKDV